MATFNSVCIGAAMPMGINMVKKGEPESGEKTVDRPIAISLALAAVLIVAVVVYVFFLRGPAEPEPEVVVEPEPMASEPAPGVAEPASARISLPPLNESDALVRMLAQDLSGHPGLADTLATDELIRKFVAAIVNIRAGESPAPHLGVLAPEGEFHAVVRNGRLVVDPASYRRYDWLAETFTSLDTAATVRLYDQLKPLMDVAYRDLGYPEGDFQDALLAAIDELLATPVLGGDIELEPSVLSYHYRNPDIESLSDVDKHLLRMGPTNVSKIQSKLRELRVALSVSR